MVRRPSSTRRVRWLVARLGVYLAGAVALAAVMTEVTTWWFRPIERIQVEGAAAFGRLNQDVFDFRGIVPLAYTVFAFAVGAAAGAVFKRTVPAMAATLVASRAQEKSSVSADTSPADTYSIQDYIDFKP